MKKVLVLGGRGQLAQCIEKLDGSFPNLNMVYLSSKEADISDKQVMEAVFEQHAPFVVINCAAYTAVDLAEEEEEKAYRINAHGPGIVAQLCEKHACRLIHISTDFVFGGNIASPLQEDDVTRPLSVYGRTKLAGEKEIMKNTKDYIILRTSWLYSEFGGNFVKTMLRLGKEKESLGVVSDQIGTPTYAVDLAKVVLMLAEEADPKVGIYHYSNEGVASWYDFAHAVFKQAQLSIALRPLSSAQFPTKAVRPAFSVMDKRKIKCTFSIEIPHWQDSLEECLTTINQKEY